MSNEIKIPPAVVTIKTPPTGAIVRALRTERGLSQQRLAKLIGVSQKAIDYWERSVNEPKASYIVALADFFGVSADYLLGRREQ